ncbi:hypothetical protein FQR65_LT20100 [Abscondita terminalis]|nr:hypothetical protein FQR65_LT20100 [Abscondita terminalis]
MSRARARLLRSLRERVATLAGTPESVFDDAYRRVRVTRGVTELIAEVHRRGGFVGVVSGGFHEVLDPLAADLGLDMWRANRLEVVGGVLSGRTIGPVIDARAKAEALRRGALPGDIPAAPRLWANRAPERTTSR